MTSNEGKHLVCDVLVLGAGPAGMAAASLAAESGRRVVLLESSPWLGGAIWRQCSASSPPPRGRYWLDRLQQSGAQCVCEATAFGTDIGPGADHAASHRHVYAQCGDHVLDVECTNLVLATGAQELFLPFPGWTLPNVMGVGGLQLLAKTGWPVQGKTVAVAGTGPLLFAVAESLKQRGAKVAVMIEQARSVRVAQFAASLAWTKPSKLWQAIQLKAKLLGVPFRTGCWPVAAKGDNVVRRLQYTDGKRLREQECDLVACGFGLVPNLQWAQILGCAIREGKVQVDGYQRTTKPNVYAAGESTGIGGDEAAVIEGQIAGLAASGCTTDARLPRLQSGRGSLLRFADRLRSAFQLRHELFALADDETIVCRCEDVTWGQIKMLEDPREVKLLTRCGMGPCQGRVCQNALRFLKSWPTLSVRPPVLPVSAGAWADIAGEKQVNDN